MGAPCPVVGARLAGPVAAAPGPVPVPDPVLARPVARSRAAFPSDRRRPVRACGACLAVAAAAPEMAGPRRGARAARPRQRPQARPGPHDRGRPRAWRERRRLAGAVGSSPPPRARRGRGAAPLDAAPRHGPPRPLRAARGGARRARRQRLRRWSGVRNPALERLRLAPRRARGAVASRRRLDRPAALHPHPAADDRSRRRPAASARPGEVDRRDPRRRQGRGRDRARARARGTARRGEPEGGFARAALHAHR